MHRYNVIVTYPNGVTGDKDSNLPLSQIVSEFALPIDETADFDEMTFRQGDRTITLTRRDPEPQIVRVMLTYEVGDQFGSDIETAKNEIRQFLCRILRDVPNLINAELLPASPDVPATEAAFRAACEREYEERPAIDHLNNLLAWMGATGAYTESSVIGENMRACSILLTDLRAALDRAQGNPIPGTDVCNDACWQADEARKTQASDPRCTRPKGHAGPHTDGRRWHWNETGAWSRRHLCGDPRFGNSAFRDTCCLNSGHAGVHEDEAGYKWE